MNTAFEEVIDYAVEGVHEAEDLFTQNEEAVKTAGNIIRPLSILTCIIGF